jgi:hypothetical protein
MNIETFRDCVEVEKLSDFWWNIVKFVRNVVPNKYKIYERRKGLCPFFLCEKNTEFTEIREYCYYAVLKCYKIQSFD